MQLGKNLGKEYEIKGLTEKYMKGQISLQDSEIEMRKIGGSYNDWLIWRGLVKMLDGIKVDANTWQIGGNKEVPLWDPKKINNLKIGD